MSLVRVVLVTAQAIGNGLAFIPPNPTPSKGRYHTDEAYILQIAPFIFKLIHIVIIWICAMFEVLFYLKTIFPAAPMSLICPSSQANTRITPVFLVGLLATILGTFIRIDCFKTLGEFFTFDLTVHPEHKLVTTRLYSWVRHPAYTGSMLLVVGLSLSHLTSGSWLTECGPLRSKVSALAVWVAWWAWTLSVGVSRAIAEDEQMRKLFPQQWDSYAAKVQSWFFPGLL